MGDRKANRIPIRVEVLECAKYKGYRKRVMMPGLNFNFREDIQTYDQFLAPNYVAHQVNGWVDKVKNKTRRSASWEIPNVQNICKLVPSGNYIESQIFRLAGLDAVRLALYPNGFGNVPMQCALFLKSCSEENAFTVRASLGINKNVKIFQGDLRASLGKKKFCSLRNIDRISISVEILEVADHPLTVHTIKKYDRLEDIYRLDPPAGLSTQCNNTATSRPTSSHMSLTTTPAGDPGAGGGSSSHGSRPTTQGSANR